MRMCKKIHASEAAYAYFLLPVHKDFATLDFLQNTVSEICNHCDPHLKLS